MWPDRLSNPGPLTYESHALPTALHGPAELMEGEMKVCGQTGYRTQDLSQLGCPTDCVAQPYCFQPLIS